MLPCSAQSVPVGAIGKGRPRPQANPLATLDHEAEDICGVEVDTSSRSRVAAGEEIDLGAVSRNADQRVKPVEKVSKAIPELPAELELERADERREGVSRNTVGDAFRETLERAVSFPRQPALDIRAD